MTLYLIGRRAAFAGALPTPLPCEVRLMGAKATPRVLLDGTPVTVKGACFTLPEALSDGAHTLTVDGVAAEGLRVSEGRVRPEGIELRSFLPVLARIPMLEERLRVLERRAQENEINWLK
jgi:hypothetical protein